MLEIYKETKYLFATYQSSLMIVSKFHFYLEATLMN